MGGGNSLTFSVGEAQCNNGTWFYNSSVISDGTVVISAPVIIRGNLTLGVDSVLIIDWTQLQNSSTSIILVSGTACLNGTLLVQLNSSSNSDPVETTIQRLLINASEGIICGQFANVTAVDANHDAENCSKAQWEATAVTTISNEDRSLSVFLVLQETKRSCGKKAVPWLLIGGVVVGSVVVLTIISGLLIWCNYDKLAPLLRMRSRTRTNSRARLFAQHQLQETAL